ncbi:hypothetical protein M569_14220, partial [Genlisea aurea]
SAQVPMSSLEASPEKSAAETLGNYPAPLSPPPPPISKDVELSRALTASSSSALFSLSENDVLFEDEWLIAVNKPPGIYCESILSSVRTFLNSVPARTQELHLSNRLDRDTSGVTLVTKSHKVAAKLVKTFTDHKVQKTYIASCIGTPPETHSILVKSGHGRSKHGAWRVYAFSDIARKLPGGSLIREMETLFQVIAVNGEKISSPSPDSDHQHIVVEAKSRISSDSDKASEVIVRAYPKSGRTHQIRLHCQYLGIPIRGDVKYDGVYEWGGRKYECHQLHAESLSFEHPVTGHSLVIQAPLPLWAQQ